MSRHLRVGRLRGSGVLLCLGVGLWLIIFFWQGLSALRAKPEVDGRALFEHEWTENDRLADGDGLGPVYNARSCVACHFQGGVGGAGTNQCNVLAFEEMSKDGKGPIRSGVIHNFATRSALKEKTELVGTARAESINTPALFGVGLIDGIADQDIKDNVAKADSAQGKIGTVKGRVRILPDGRVGKFGWRAQFATLEEFVAAACSNEIGLGTPHSAQARPLHWPNYPARQADLDQKQFAALLSFVDTLPRPVRDMPADKEERARAEHGEALFHQVGCATCHTPDLGGVQGIYSDLQLHRVVYYGNSGEEPAPEPSAYPLPDEWKTPPLWGVADSAPYFHDGACDSLKGAILRHQGEAKNVKEAYTRLSPGEQEEVGAFLRTLKAPSDTAPTNGPGRELQKADLPLKPPPDDTLGSSDW